MFKARFLALALSALPISSAAQCRQALALGLDVSGSVDLREYRLQMDGVVASLNDPEIVQILLAMPSAPIRLMIYEWSGPADQKVLLPWTSITGLDSITEITATLASTQRREATPGTALGIAMNYGAQKLTEQSGRCWKLTLDISGDGRSNLGPRPRYVKEKILESDITVNALVIGSSTLASRDQRQSEISQLSSYFRAEVISGPDSFVQTASAFEDYSQALTQKLKKELEGVVVGRLQ
ncbi:MAG: DUF1194 domain-containing protein [Roseobacter sp.]